MKRDLLPLLAALGMALAQSAFALETQPLDPSAPAEPGYGAEMSPAPTATESVPAASEPAPAASDMPPAEAAAPVDTAAPAAYSEPSYTPPAKEGFEANYLDFMGGYVMPNHHRSADVKKGMDFEAIYGHKGDGHFGWEAIVAADNFETGNNQGTDFYRYTFGADLTFSLGDRRTFTPFLLIGGGGDYNDTIPDENDKLSYYGNAGVGFVTAPLTRVGELKLRGEARWIYDGYDRNPQGQDQKKLNGDWRFSLGIEIPLFAHHGYMTAATNEHVGVVPLTSAEAPACKEVEAPTAYVDSAGCALPRVLELKGVTFEFDKVRLRPDAETILNYVADIIKRYPEMQVEIAGHTDSLGSAAYNQNLSQRRAQAVIDYLVKSGVPAGQVTAHGYGEAQPRDTNDTEVGRERNRRVELRILNDVTPTTEPSK